MKKTPLNQQKKRVDTSKMSAGLAKKIKKAEAIRDKQDEKKKKEVVKKYKPTALETKNLKDATENKNMRPPFNQKKKNNK